MTQAYLFSLFSVLHFKLHVEMQLEISASVVSKAANITTGGLFTVEGYSLNNENPDIKEKGDYSGHPHVYTHPLVGK